MLPHLLRKEFPDRTWDAADLDTAVEFWLRLFEDGAREAGLRSTPCHDTEVRLRGFPRAWGDTLVREVVRRTKTSGFTAPAVELRDPDTLVLSSGAASADQSPPTGLGLPLLAGDGFDGLCAEIRFRVAGPGRRWPQQVAASSTLVLVGELRDGRFVLKALWRTGADGWEDETCWAGSWPYQDECLRAFDQYRKSDEVSRPLAKKLFAPRVADRGAGLFVRLIRVPLGRPRLRGLVLRGLIFALVFAAAGLGVYAGIEAGTWALALPFVVAVLFVGWLAAAFARNEARMLFRGYTQFRGRYTRLYEVGAVQVPLTPAEAAPRLDHPWARKHTADLEAAGFTHAGDLGLGPQVAGDFVTRVFLAPDGVTYLSVLFLTTTHPDPADGFRMWPSGVALLAHTYFPDGARASSVNGRHSGYRRKRTGPDSLERLFPDATDPVEFVRLHAAAAERFGEEISRAPLRHERFDLFVRRQNDAQEESRRLNSEDPYNWGDHLGWYLQRPRREYLE